MSSSASSITSFGLYTLHTRVDIIKFPTRGICSGGFKCSQHIGGLFVGKTELVLHTRNSIFKAASERPGFDGGGHHDKTAER